MANVYATLWGLIAFSGFVTTLLTPQTEKYAAAYRDAVTVGALSIARRWVVIVRRVPLLVLALVVSLSVTAPVVLRGGADPATGWDLFLLAIAVVAQFGFVVTIRTLIPVVPAQLPVLSPTSVTDRHQLTSPPSQSVTTIRFVNRTQQPLDLHWIDFEGVLIPYGTIAALDEDRIQSTYAGHWFLLTDSNGHEIVMFKAEPTPAIAVIDDVWLRSGRAQEDPVPAD